MNVGSWNSNSINMLFSSVGNRNSVSNNSGFYAMTSLLSDYQSLKSGSYGKLVKAYYAKQAEDEAGTVSKKKNDKNTSSTSTAEDSTKTLSNIQTATDALYETAESLRKEARSAEGMDELYKTASQFVTDYNKTVDAATKSETKNIKSNLKDMMNATSVNKKLLGNIGITVGEDNKLTIDEKKFKDGSLSTAKTLFDGAGSYAYNVSLEASMINSNADYEASKANTYNTEGGFSNNHTAGDMFDSLF